MLTAAAIRCTVERWPLAAAGAAEPAGSGETAARSDRDGAIVPPVLPVAPPREPPRPN